MLVLTRSLFLFFLALLPFSLRADMGIWNRMLFSDKSYANHLEVKAYILTDRQASSLLANPSDTPIQLIGSELAKFPRKYLVVRVKNLGNKHSWGTLACSLPRVWDPVKIPIITIGQDFCDYLICLEGIAVVDGHEALAPKVTYKWDKLYTK